MKGSFVRLTQACLLAGLTKQEVVRELAAPPAAVGSGRSASGEHPVSLPVERRGDISR
jgi:hypothetical protein